MELTTTLQSLGFTSEEIDALYRIAHTLRRWHEMECGTESGCIERDDTTGRPYWLDSRGLIRRPIADRGTGARRRLAAILARRNERVAGAPLDAYIQSDPRGAALRRYPSRGKGGILLHTRHLRLLRESEMTYYLLRPRYVNLAPPPVPQSTGK